MSDTDRDTLMRLAAFEHVRRLSEVYDHLTAEELKPGFVFEGERIPLVNPQRGIFKPRQMKYLLLTVWDDALVYVSGRKVYVAHARAPGLRLRRPTII